MEGPTDLLHLESRFRLTGEVGGRHRTFLLVRGDNRIGSQGSNDIVLKAPGVSRQHAVLSIDETAATLTDLGSKNGTFVNDAAVSKTNLEVDDQVRFGSVKLVLAEIDDEEAAMAFVVSKPSTGGSEPRPAELETEVARDFGEVQALWLELLDRYLSALCLGGPAALSSALGQMARGLGAEGVLLCDRQPAGEPLVRAAWGQEHQAEGGGETVDEILDAVEALETDSDTVFRFGIRQGRLPYAYSLWRAAGRAWVLVFLGRFESMEASDVLLRAVLSAAVLTFSDDVAEASSTAGDRRSDLTFPDGHVVGGSAPARLMYRQLETACRASFPVLVLGETGVGKEHVAQILHLSSPRHPAPFVAINCAAIPAGLLEAELFGIRKGVATGVTQRRGRFQMAQEGTLFLDEVGDMPVALQAKLLRALEAGEVTPVGGVPQPVDVRIVAATNADLLEHVEKERFRRDLYYRLAGYVVHVPPLRERRDDIPAFVEHFLRQLAEESGRNVRGITLRALRALSWHDWPGNIRELIHEVRRLVYGCHDGEAVDLALLSPHVLAAKPPADDDRPETDSLDLSEHTAALERRLIENALERTGGNRSQAARLLGVSRQGLAMKIERLDLKRDFREPDS